MQTWGIGKIETPIQMLLEHGADPQAKADNGEMPEDIALRDKQGKIFDLLRESEARTQGAP